MKRKLLIAAIVSSFVITACNSSEKTESTDSATQTEQNTADAIEADRLKAEQEMMSQDSATNASDTTGKAE